LKFAEIQSLSASESSQEGRLGLFNMLLRRRVSQTVESLGVVLPGNAMVEWKEKNNVFALSPGLHGGKIIAKPDTEIHAPAPGAIITKPLDITTDAVIDAVAVMPPSASGVLVTVRAGASAVIRGCTFEQPGDETSSHINIEDGGKLVLLGCVFRGSATSSDYVVAHAVGAATDVQVALCYNKTGNTLFTATVAQVSRLTITTVGAVGNSHAVTVDGVTGTHVVIGGDTTSTVVDALIAALAAAYPPAGPLGEWPVTLTDGGANFLITAKVAGTAFSISYLGTGTAAATLTTLQPNVAATAIGTGNI